MDPTLGLTEGQEPQLPDIAANIIINNQPECNLQFVFDGTRSAHPVSCSIPLVALILESVKQNIWADEYVELVQLLKPSD